jgi:hypothetical protein
MPPGWELETPYETRYFMKYRFSPFAWVFHFLLKNFISIL